MRRLAPWLVVTAAILLLPIAAVAAGDDGSGQPLAGRAVGTITLCPGFPVPPSEKLLNDGVLLTRGEVCHVYSGTISGTLRGTQDTAVFSDTSRIAFGTEQLDGSVAGRSGMAEFSYSASRPCFPTCPSTVHLTATSGSGALRGLTLEITAFGGATLAYSGTYSLGVGDSQQEGQ